MDSIGVIHVPSIELYALDDFDIIVNRYRIDYPSNLRYLVTDVQVFIHELLTSQQVPVHVLIFQGVEHPVHAPGVFFIRHVRYIDL